MPRVFFPDNTVLVNFAYLHRMDLLRRLARNPAWCATVADECSRSSQGPDLEDMAEAWGIFGEPLRPDSPVEHLTVQDYKRRLGKPGDSAYSNLGEAETLAIIECRSIEAIFVTDDAAAAAIARGSQLQIKVASTWDLLWVATRRGFVDRDTAWSYVSILRTKSRHLPPGQAARDRRSFDEWLDG